MASVNLGQEKTAWFLGATRPVTSAVACHVQEDQGNVYRCYDVECRPLPPDDQTKPTSKAAVRCQVMSTAPEN